VNLYPAIDLLDGHVVRLRQGDYADSTVYGLDPVEVALSFKGEGATWVHIVDLNAARTGDPVNRSVIAGVVAALDGAVSVQVGGGVRSAADATQLRDAGVTRVVMGSAAIADPELVGIVGEVLDVAVGIDHRGGIAATHGWTETSGTHVADLLGSFPTAAAFVITDISRDGMLSGPDIDGLIFAVTRTSIPVVASGGVGALEHLEQLTAVPGLEGVIVGKALYENKFTVAEAIGVLS
jgi:phosphoribosylformimino-5-aminoimidazole carboxamide ribotide isomerase